jgi:hypothetical protein
LEAKKTEGLETKDDELDEGANVKAFFFLKCKSKCSNSP